MSALWSLTQVGRLDTVSHRDKLLYPNHALVARLLRPRGCLSTRTYSESGENGYGGNTNRIIPEISFILVWLLYFSWWRFYPLVFPIDLIHQFCYDVSFSPITSLSYTVDQWLCGMVLLVISLFHLPAHWFTCIIIRLIVTNSVHLAPLIHQLIISVYF